MEKSDKTKRIGMERRRLLKIFRDLDDNKHKACQSLIDRAAFIKAGIRRHDLLAITALDRTWNSEIKF